MTYLRWTLRLSWSWSGPSPDAATWWPPARAPPWSTRLFIRSWQENLQLVLGNLLRIFIYLKTVIIPSSFTESFPSVVYLSAFWLTCWMVGWLRVLDKKVTFRTPSCKRKGWSTSQDKVVQTLVLPAKSFSLSSSKRIFMAFLIMVRRSEMLPPDGRWPPVRAPHWSTRLFVRSWQGDLTTRLWK